jgi:hypothetical protein
VTEDLEFLRDARERFQGKEIERLYRSWRLGEFGEPELRAQLSQQKPEGAIFFETYLVNGHRSSHTENVEQGDRCMKDTVHPSVHRLKSIKVALCATKNLGAGKTPEWAGNDPTFAHGSVAKVTLGSFQPIAAEQDRVLPARRSWSMQFVMQVVMRSE